MNFNSQNCTSNDPGHVASLALDVHNVEEAWLVTCGDPDIVVAVVDVFSSQLHEDLQGKIDTIFQIEAMDAEWLECHHGISTAGIIGALPQNGIATTGVGYDTKVALYNVGSSCGNGGPLGGFNTAVTNGEDIINLSWQGAGSPANPGLTAAMAQNYINGGGVLVTAGGDNNWNNIAGIDGVINVGRMAWDASINSYIHLDYLTATEDRQCEIYITAYNIMRLMEFDQWGSAGSPGGAAGTSAMAPIISGVVALIKSVNANLTPAEIECIIKLSAKGNVVGAPADAWAKYLDAEAAVIMAGVWPNISIGEETILTGTQTLTNITATGHIRVKTGADITVTGSINLGHSDSRIFVERGARLNIDGADVSPISCIDDWRGFVVEGNSAKQQPTNPLGILQSDDAGVLILQNQATVNNARNAVSMHNTHKSPVLAYTGGLVIANNTTFQDNRRSFEFMMYNLGENSLITNCTFNNNQNYVITAWRDQGLQFDHNTFNNYNRDGVFALSSPFTSNDNTYTGPGIANDLDFLLNNKGININNSTMVESNYVIENSRFSLNLMGVKIEATDGPDRTRIHNITSTFDDIGVLTQGSDSYRIDNGTFANDFQSIVSANSGDARNRINDNYIGAASNGLLFAGQNDLLTFYQNCFEGMPNSSALNDVEVLFGVTLNPIQQSDNNTGPDNCYQINTGDIEDGGDVTVGSGIFQYGADPSISTHDCRVPALNNIFSYLDRISLVEGCDSPPTGYPTIVQNFYCGTNSNSVAELDIERANILSDIAQLESLSYLTFAQKRMLRILKRCLAKIEVKLAKKLIELGSFNDLRAKLKGSELPFSRVGIVSFMINRGLYLEGQNFMNAVVDSSQEWVAYKQSQNILIDFLVNYEDFKLTAIDKLDLEQAGQEVNYYAAFIRGVYAEIVGESILLDFTFGRSIKPRNNTQFEKEITLLLSPNPVSDLLQIESHNGIFTDIRISDFAGQTVNSLYNLSSNNQVIDVSNLTQGVYFITVSLSNSERIVQKFIKL